MKKRMTTLAFVAMAMAVGLHAQNAAQAGTHVVDFEETDIIANPTKKQLVGIWQILFRLGSEGRKYASYFKIMDADGHFRNLSIINARTYKHDISVQGTWKVKDGALIETISPGIDNPLAGKTNAMEMTLSEGGKLMHIIWMNATTGVRVDEYWEKIQ